MYNYREASKMQKLLRIKCKEMLSQGSNKRYDGIIDDPEMNLWPAPLKIVYQTLNSMKEFRVRILFIALVLKNKNRLKVKIIIIIKQDY